MSRRPTTIAVFDGYGGVERVALVDADRPEPGDDEVLIQVVASGVSHMDAYVREGRFQDAVPLAFPARQGCSFAGIVRTVGRNVREFSSQDEVFGHDPAHGAHATFITVPAIAVVKKPAGLTWEVASALYLVGLTAFSLITPLRLQDGDTVLVSAAAGGVGHLECQLARIAGARVVGIAGRENHDYLRSIGVRPVGYGDALEDDVREAAGGRPITAMLDNYGGYDELADRLGVPPGRRARTEDRRAAEIELYTSAGDPARRLQLRDMAELVAEWNVRLLVSGFYSFASLEQALLDLDARHSRGVVVVGMQTSAPAGEYLRGKLRAHHEAGAAAS
jgi:NADPH2:quinone reductase